MRRQAYRPDIDGLRAIAVLSVLIHHLNEPLLPGGFVGVDIFFVISGFLITAQVHAEAREGPFSIRQFYKRRINRIVPALFTVVAACLAAGAFLLSPADLLLLARSAVYASIGLSNVFFWREYGNYFAGNAREAPLLHTWSLGIEEQFYVIWPLLVLLLARTRPRLTVILVAALTVASIALSEVAAGLFASASYYLLPTRFFELMIGGLLALSIAAIRPRSQPQARLGLIAGLLIVGGSLLLLSRSSVFPGVNAMWPCLGTALLIWAGSGQGLPTRLLTNRPLVFLGLISYSLYLWHWPVIAFLAYLDHPIGLAAGIAAAAASILLAWLSWKYIEVPMRRSGVQLQFPRVFTLRFLFPVVALLSVLAATNYGRGFPQRFDPRVAELERMTLARPEEARRGCHVPTALYRTPPHPDCRLGAVMAVPDGILIGDSYANHFTGMIDVMAKDAGLAFMDYTMDACPPIRGYEPEGARAYAEKCLLRNEAIYQMIRTNRYRQVILAANWPDTPEAGRQLATSIEAIVGSGAIVTIVMRNTTIARANSCPLRRIMYGTADDCQAAPQSPPGYFKEIRSRYPLVRFIDPNEIVCQGEKCSPMVGDTILYRDSNHLNDIGSRLIGQALLRKGAAL